jgi:hypothetical protein
MAKGDYKKEFGGSKSGYQKGIKDTLKVIGVSILSLASIIIATVVAKKR